MKQIVKLLFKMGDRQKMMDAYRCTTTTAAAAPGTAADAAAAGTGAEGVGVPCPPPPPQQQQWRKDAARLQASAEPMAADPQAVPPPPPSPAVGCTTRSGTAAAAAGCRIYELYSDYVLKNPFYELDQVIKCDLFDESVDFAVKRYPLMLLAAPQQVSVLGPLVGA